MANSPAARRTKIVATIGPATQEPEVLTEVLRAGVDVTRLNLAHGLTHTQRELVPSIRAIAAELGRVVGILADLPGPKMRTGPIEEGVVSIEEGHRLLLTHEDVPGTAERVSTTVDGLAKIVGPGDEIFFGDGSIVVTVVSSHGSEVVTEVKRGGLLRSRKGMHVPGSERKVEAFTQDDRDALEFACSFGVDFVGLSFVRDADDIRRARKYAAAHRHIPSFVAKIETRAAVDNLAEIVREADAVMVARGDLGIQMPLRNMPLLQKEIISTCNRAGKPVITATEMLESMTQSPLPTRAEVSDVANAVIDGTDAVMLSGETAVGEYPVETVKAMADIAVSAETLEAQQVEVTPALDDDPVSWAIARAAVHAAEDLNVSAILCPTRSGATARRVAAFRPRMPVLGLAHREETAGLLALIWGVVPFVAPFLPEGKVATEAVERAVAVARRANLVHSGELVAVVAGGPEPRAGSTDFVRIVAA
ncbi:MAG TPA: pyruvate kinase [Actinomycetota bacterium]|nr:pyruvate kinase [Actinomycetota bacterium]